MSSDRGTVDLRAVDDAIEAVALRVVFRAVEDYTENAWEDFPEIGEHDWALVAKRANYLVSHDPCDYDAAYALLTARAETEATR